MHEGLSGPVPLANSILFAGSVVSRSHGEQPSRPVDVVRSACAAVVVATQAPLRWRPRPRGAGQALQALT